MNDKYVRPSAPNPRPIPGAEVCWKENKTTEAAVGEWLCYIVYETLRSCKDHGIG
jgi:hypothetical protein